MGNNWNSFDVSFCQIADRVHRSNLMRLQYRLFLVGRFVTNPQKMILTFYHHLPSHG